MSREDLLENLRVEVLKIAEKHNRIALRWCTGLGKSKASIDILKYIKNKKGTNLRVLLVVAETVHKKNWEIEFQKWSCDYSQVTVECYTSLKKYKDTTWDLIIFDEAHHLGSDIRIELLTTITSDNIILLSATLPQDLLYSIGAIYGKFEVHVVTLKQAIECGLLPKPKVYLIPLKLDNTYYNQSVCVSWGIKSKRVVYKCKMQDRWKYMANKREYPNVELIISCTQQQKYDYLTSLYTYWKNKYMRSRSEWIKLKWLHTGSERKRFLGDCKTESLRILIHKIKDKRFICFCSSIEQAEIIGGKNAIHSNKAESQKIIEDFNDKTINSLFAVNMLQEGQNLPNIEVGVITQLDGKERAFVQKFGRSLRAEDPIQFIFYYENTKDVDYLQNVLEGINEEYIIKVDNLLNLDL